MFAVIFEVLPDPARVAEYLERAMQMKPEVERIEGFVSVERFAARDRAGWVLSLSFWHDAAAIARWRSHAGHHRMQVLGRRELFLDYRLRVGEVIRDRAAGRPREAPPPGSADPVPLRPDRIAVLLEAASEATGDAPALPDRQVFDSLYRPGRAVLLGGARDADAAIEWGGRALASPRLASSACVYAIGIVRDYGMFAREEAPQAG
jgi:heme-degrading monooxygenase HmoA